MKLIILSLSIAISCSACSDEDIQISLEKKEVALEQTKTGIPSKKHQTETQKIITSNNNGANLTQQKTAIPIKNVIAVEQTQTAITLEKTSQGDAVMQQELEASLSSIDDANIMSAYDSNGSAINLTLGGIDLIVSKRDLVSKVTSVSGATSITGDPNGFGFSIDLSGDYLFEFDKDTLTQKAQAALASVLILYQDYQGTNIDIAGHTDSKGNNSYNMDLSKRRSNAVKQWFNKQGVSSNLINTTGYGETKPIAENTQNGQDHPVGRAQNRRVEIKVKTQKTINHLPTVSKPSNI